MTKEELRIQLQKKRDLLPDNEAESRKIAEEILHAPFFGEAVSVMLYRSARSEVITDYLWQKCMEAGKICLFPKCISKTEMIAVKADSDGDFQKGRYGIFEPISDVPYPKEQIDLIIVPGLGFDKRKYRIGYGAGYYDRYLSDYSGITVGLCREELLTESVLPDVYDVKLSFIATQKEIF